jgi:hypothetical protein
MDDMILRLEESTLSDATPFRFLELSRELRDQIYRWMISDPELEEWGYGLVAPGHHFETQPLFSNLVTIPPCLPQATLSVMSLGEPFALPSFR